MIPPPPTSEPRKRFGWREAHPAAGMLAFGAAIGALAAVGVDADSTWSDLTLYSAAAGAGAASFFLGAGGIIPRLCYAVPGGVSGLGSICLAVHYPAWFHRSTLLRGELVLVAMLGAVPGLLLMIPVAGLVESCGPKSGAGRRGKGD